MKRLVVLVLVSLALLGATGAFADASDKDEASFLFAVAQLARFQGLYDEALEAFGKAVAADPQDPYLHLEFGEFLFQMGRLTEAAEHADAAREAAPASREALRLSGRIQLRLGERSAAALGRARDSLEQLRAMDPLDVDVRVTLGRLYLGRSRPASAVEPLREARSLRPGDRLITSLLVDALGGLGDDPAVLQELQRIVEDDPAFLQPRLSLAQALSRKGDQESVIELLEKAPEETRANIDYLRLLAFAFYRIGDFEKALAVNERGLARRPDDTTARYLKSLTLAAVGRYAEAEDVLARLLEENPDSREFTLALAEIVERQGRHREAGAILRSLGERLESENQADESRRIFALLADVKARAGEWDEVLALADSMLARPGTPADDPFHLLRIRALQELGRFEDALRDLRILGQVPGLEDRAVARRAEILFSAGRRKEGEKALEKLSRARDVDKLMLAAEVLHAAELYSQAVPVLNRAEKIAPENLEVVFWLGASFERSGRIADADKAFRRLLEQDENFAPALNYLGYMWADLGENLDEALALAQKAVTLEPSNGAYLDSLGWAYFQSGRYEEARGPLERAAKLVGDDPIVFEHLGDLYRAIGKAEQAAAAYEKALALDSENEAEVRRKLDEIADQ